MAPARGQKQDRAQPAPNTRAKQAGHPHLLRGGNPGRPKGIKQTAPRKTAKVKASLARIYEALFQKHEKEIEKRILQGIRGFDAESFHHLRLAGEYLDGKPATVVNLKGSQPVMIVLAGEEPEESE